MASGRPPLHSRLPAGPAPLRRLYSLSAVLACLLLALSTAPAHAQIGSDRYASIVVEADNGRVLSAANAEEPRHPASLTKMMTLYMVFEALRDRRITLHQSVPVSAHAASMPPTKLGLVPGGRITVEQGILGLVTKSANDAAAALGELLGGDEARFAQMMTLRARALGMRHTLFRNASGLPDPEQVTTAYDLSLLARHLVHDFPRQYRYFSVPSFSFHGRTINTHDYMLDRYPGTDGIKTGYTNASGFNLVTSVVRNNVRLIGVVMGAARPGERDLHMISLLNQAYDKLDVPAPGRIQTASRMGAIVPAAQAATLPHPAPPRAAAGWAVQVGAYLNQAAARRAAANARKLADVGEIRLESVVIRHRTYWRAQLAGLRRAEASGACTALARHKLSCALIRPESGEIASR
ncbi:MAG: D-alanyl-D-alanine carboxypeptidase [Rhodospirillales bacterium]|nr:D-alanyl-D-alanine carboxypeptidase [Rhodospirillales bacterium]